MNTDCQTSGYQRADLRVPLAADAIVRHQGRALTARMLDLSRSGAALSAPVPPPRDAEVMLELGGMAIAGRIAWTAGSRFGLRFEIRLRATEVFLISRQSRVGAGGQTHAGGGAQKRRPPVARRPSLIRT